ncbi:MAG: hypothetical protein H6733_15155 [Alphaproteobacteria bacterium]|nr:hypothetical protein [Alphaproteobacteria bacterium]
MPDHHAAITRHLAILRGALDALGVLGDDLPDPERLAATLEALDPALSGDAFAPAGWVAGTELPAPSWIERVHAFKEQTDELTDESEIPDQGLVSVTALAPELGQRLMSQRTFHRFVRRHDLFPPPGPSLHAAGGATWWTWDALLSDGRWGRLRVEGATPRRAPAGDRWFTLSFDDLEAELAYATVRRCVVGPAWRDGARRVAGLFATLEVSGDTAVHRLAVDRMRAEDVGLGDVLVTPFALPGA